MSKHKAPLRCRLNNLVFGRSIAIIYARCSLGCKKTCKKCSGCERNMRELWVEAFTSVLGGVSNETD